MKNTRIKVLQKVNNGSRTMYGKDVWIGNATLKNRFPHLYITKSNKICMKTGVESQQLMDLLALFQEHNIMSNQNDSWA